MKAESGRRQCERGRQGQDYTEAERLKSLDLILTAAWR